MRKMILALVAFSTATLFAGGIQVSPNQVTLTVGDKTVLRAANAPGGLSAGYPYNVTFFSDDPGVAQVSGFASGTGYAKPDPIPYNGDVYVTAIRAGIAHVHVKDCCGDLATIIVRPQPVLAVHPDEVTVTRGKPVMLLAAVTDAPSYVTYEWFRGHTGDESKSLQVSGSPVLTFTPDASSNAVWVRATSATWQSTAEVKVSSAPVRRRAAQ